MGIITKDPGTIIDATVLGATHSHAATVMWANPCMAGTMQLFSASIIVMVHLHRFQGPGLYTVGRTGETLSVRMNSDRVC